nr:unnamed protein product [Callosobruchus chinensis]
MCDCNGLAQIEAIVQKKPKEGHIQEYGAKDPGSCCGGCCIDLQVLIPSSLCEHIDLQIKDELIEIDSTDSETDLDSIEIKRDSTNTIMTTGMTATEFFNLASKILPHEYDGSPDRLQSFLDGHTLLTAYATGNEQSALAYIKTRLCGKARDLIGDNDSLQDIAQKLRQGIKTESSQAVISKILAKLKRAYISEGVPAAVAETYCTKTVVRALSTNASSDRAKLIMEADIHLEAEEIIIMDKIDVFSMTLAMGRNKSGRSNRSPLRERHVSRRELQHRLERELRRERQCQRHLSHEGRNSSKGDSDPSFTPPGRSRSRSATRAQLHVAASSRVFSRIDTDVAASPRKSGHGGNLSTRKEDRRPGGSVPSAMKRHLNNHRTPAKPGSYRLHKAVCTRWEHILTNGVGKENLLELHARHVIPDNCPLLSPPKINPEIQLALTPPYITRDHCHQRSQ